MTGASLRDIFGDGNDANVVFYNTKSSPSSDESGLRSGGCEMTILCSDYRRIIVESSFYWRKHSGSFR